MTIFDVAHIREQGQDIIIVLVDRSFGNKSQSEQNQITGKLQMCARSAGLAGTVVPVWDSGRGRMGFLAPQPWHPFFKGLSLSFVAANINRRLTCG